MQFEMRRGFYCGCVAGLCSRSGGCEIVGDDACGGGGGIGGAEGGAHGCVAVELGCALGGAFTQQRGEPVGHKLGSAFV